MLPIVTSLGVSVRKGEEVWQLWYEFLDSAYYILSQWLKWPSLELATFMALNMLWTSSWSFRTFCQSSIFSFYMYARYNYCYNVVLAGIEFMCILHSWAGGGSFILCTFSSLTVQFLLKCFAILKKPFTWCRHVKFDSLGIRCHVISFSCFYFFQSLFHHYTFITVGALCNFSDQTRQTTWLHPLTGEPVQTGYTTLAGKSHLRPMPSPKIFKCYHLITYKWYKCYQHCSF